MNGVRVAVHQSSRRSDRRKLLSITASPSVDGRVRDGAEMDHRVELAPVEPAEQVGRRHHVGDLALLQVAPLAVRAEPVVHGDVGAAGLVEARDHVRPDETRPAGHQNHQRIPRPLGARPSFAPLGPGVQSW